MKTSIPIGLATAVDRLNTVLGRIGGWCYPLICLVIVINVLARYVFAESSVALEESGVYLNALGFFLCFAYAYLRDDHVRIDVLRGTFSPRTKTIIELVGNLVLVLPFCVIVGSFAWLFFLRSWHLLEGSPNPGGLPVLFAIKFLFFLAFVLLGLQSLATIVRSVRALAVGEEGDAAP